VSESARAHEQSEAMIAFPIQNDFQMFSNTGESFTLSPLRRSGSYADHVLPPIALRKYLGSELKNLALGLAQKQLR